MGGNVKHIRRDLEGELRTERRKRRGLLEAEVGGEISCLTGDKHLNAERGKEDAESEKKIRKKR